jgi:capsular polysaccharide biosynthesis protein
VTVPDRAGGSPSERSWSYGGSTSAGDRPSNYSVGLPSLRFIGAALRRSLWVWCGIAAAGLLIGLALSVIAPPAQQAATTVLLSHNPYERPSDAILTDMAMAESRPVAQQAMAELKLRENLSSFLAAYTVTPLTDRMVLITVGAPTVTEAQARANAVASAFLEVRARALRSQQPSMVTTLNQRVAAALRQVYAVSAQIDRVSKQRVTSAQEARLDHLKLLGHRAQSLLSGERQALVAFQLGTASQAEDSRVIDKAAAVTHTHRTLSPRITAAILYAATGLIPGLAFGAGFVIVRALVSERLRRRDDIAGALGAPIGLSVGAIRLKGGGGLAAARGDEVQRIVRHLRKLMPEEPGQVAGLAVVPVDDADVAALSVTALAASYAQEGKRVALADLWEGTPAARLLGIGDPGVHTVEVDGSRLVVAVPEAGSVAPGGPFAAPPGWDRPSQELVAVGRSADVLLTLARLDPSVGGEHLATWCSDAVVMVTAGCSSGAAIHAASEMVQTSGIRLASAVLVGADRADESLGVPHPAAPPVPVAYSLPRP